MTQFTTLVAEERKESGTGAARAFRRVQKIPAVVYKGQDKPHLLFTLPEREINKLYRKGRFLNTVLEIQIGSTSYKMLPKDVDLHPISDLVRHVDFIHLHPNQQKVAVPIEFTNQEKAAGLKRGGFLNIIRRKLLLLCPSEQIPHTIEMDISEINIGATIKASQFTLPQGCSLAIPANTVIASILGKGGKEDENKQAEAAAVK